MRTESHSTRTSRHPSALAHRRRVPRGREKTHLGIEVLEERLMLAFQPRDLLIADPATDSIRRFDGSTGAALGAFVASGSGGLVDPHNPTFGPDGNLYVFSQAPGAQKILRYNGSTGAFLGTFVNTGVGGFSGGSAMAFGPGGDLFVATATSRGVLRYDGATGAFEGIAASGNGIQRACGVEFGPDGDLYVLDADSASDTGYDRILRFNATTSSFIDVFVQSGSLENACAFTFGPDGQLYVPDLKLEQTRSFNGTTGKFQQVFTAGSSAADSLAFDLVFGPDGNAYAATADRILRYEGETGDLLDTFVDGTGGSIVFFPSSGSTTDLAVTGVQMPDGVVQGSDLAITYTVTNRSTNQTAIDEWVDVAYLSSDDVFDSSDSEIGRIQHTTGLAGGGSYTETVTAVPDVSLGDYHVFVFADRRGTVNDPARINNLATSAGPLRVFPPLASSHDPNDSIALGRSLSAYSTADVTRNELTLTYTVYNLTDGYVTGLLMTTTLEPGVMLARASLPPDQNGQEFAWSLGTLAPFDRTSIEVIVSFSGAVPLQLDNDARAFGSLDYVAVSDAAPPATLRSGAIGPELLAATPDADSSDPFIQEKAAELDYDPKRMFDFLTQEVGYESYVGSLRGSRGTLWSSAGNSLDEASLMIALLRASGIPARYAQGTLAVPFAQELILSMFPEQSQVIGFIPDGTTVSDPVHDPQLLAESRQHFWVQFDAGAGFVDADAAFADAQLGDTFTAADSSFTEVPDALRHKVTVRLNRELTIPLSGLLGGGSQFVATVLNQTFDTAALAGRPLSIGNFVNQNALGSLVFSSMTNTYSPYIQEGDIAYPISHDHVIRGTDYQEMLTNFPLGSQVLTGVFLEVTLTGPDGSAETYERTLADRIGFDVRQSGGSPNLAIDPLGPPLLTDFDVFTLNVLPGRYDPAPSPRLAEEVGALAKLLTTLQSTNGGLGPESTTSMRDLFIGLTRLHASSFLGFSDLHTTELAEVSQVKAYFDRPRLVITANRRVADGSDSGGSLALETDLRRDTIRAIAFPGQAVAAVPSFRSQRGVTESVLEGSIIQFADANAQQPRSVSTAVVFDEALRLGIPFVDITSDNLFVLDGLAISGEAKARITATIANGHKVVVPEQPVTINGVATIGWFDIQPGTGEIVGVMENGSHQGITEYGAILAFVGILVLAVLLSTKKSEVDKVVDKLKECTDKHGAELKKCVEAVKTQLKEVEKIKDLSYTDSVRVGDVRTGITLLELGLKADKVPDPPIPPQLLSISGAEFIPDNLASTLIPINATLAPGPVASTVRTSHLSVSNQLSASWSSTSNSSFRVTSLSASLATVRNGTGAVIGSGDVLITGNTVPVQVTGDVDYSLAGMGTLSFYGDATTNLGVSGDWDNYTATLSGDIAFKSSTGSVSLNGITLPAGSYTVSANSATLIGSGPTGSPNFQTQVSIAASDGAVSVGNATGNTVVNSVSIDGTNGFALSHFTGTAIVTADGDADLVNLEGSTAQVIAASASPAQATTDQNTAVTFEIALKTTVAGPYRIAASAPDRWDVGMDLAGRVTVTPAPGAQSGTFPVHFALQSMSNPELIAHVEASIIVRPTQPAIDLTVASDTMLFASVGGGQLPSVFRASVRNLGPAPETIDLAFNNVPAGFEPISSVDAVTVPAGETAIVGFYLNPTGQLPPAGTDVSFAVTATSRANSAITDTQAVSFAVPEVHGVTITAGPAALSTIPGVSGNTTLTVTAVGNVPENVTFDMDLSPGLALTGLTNVALAPGQKSVQTLTFTPSAGTRLNSSLVARITANFNGREPVTITIPVRVAAPGADAIARASTAAEELGNHDLANRLNDLSIALTNLVQNQCSDVSKSQSLANLDSILTLLTTDPILVSFVGPLATGRDQLAAAATTADCVAATNSIGSALDDFAVATTALSKSNFEAFLMHNTQVAQPLVPTVFHVMVHNIGTDTSTYDLAVSDLPAGVTSQLGETSVTLDRDEFADVTLTLTQTATNELVAFSFDIDVSIHGITPAVTKAATGSLSVRKEVVGVVSVAADPPFADPGAPIDVSARLLNAVNRQQDALARFTVKDSTGNTVFTSADKSVTLGVVQSLLTVDLGSVNTTTLPFGEYSVIVSLTDLNGVPIPGATGIGNFLVGSPVTASLAVLPDVLPPGTSTVTNTLTIESQQPIPGALELAGQAAVAGSTDVVRNGDFLYVAGSAGISVLNIAGANLSDPQLVRVVGTATNLLEIHGNLLVAVRFGLPTTRLDTYSLTDPSNPQFLGTTGNIPYASATEIVVTDTHVFVVFVNLVFDSFSRVILAQNGGVFAVNITDPTAPFFDGDAVALRGTPAGRDGVDDGVLFNQNGTSNDGIGTFPPTDTSGGNQMTWDVVQVAPTILLVMGSSSTGNQPLTGMGLIRVVDISDPRNMRLLRDIVVPGTVHAFGVAVEGDIAVVTATQGGLQNGSHVFAGNIVLATLNLNDPANPQITHTEVTGESARAIGFASTVGDGLFAFGSGGPAGTEPMLNLLDVNLPGNPVFAGFEVPVALQGVAGGNGLIFTTDQSSLIVYRIVASPGIPVTAQVQVPSGTGVAIVPGSFSTTPTHIIPGGDFDTLVFDLAPTSASPAVTITWQSTVSDLQPGEARDVTLDTTIDFASQGTPGQVVLPPQSVVSEQVLSLDPAARTVQPGESAHFTVTIANPGMLDVTYDLSVAGVPPEWVGFPAQVTVPAGEAADLDLTLTSDPFAPRAEFGFVINANAGSVASSVQGTLRISGDPQLPEAEPDAHGVVVSLTPQSATAGQGTVANFVARVTNTGSVTETYALSADLPPGFAVLFEQSTVVVSPGASNFRDVPLSVTPPSGTAPGDYAFAIMATLTTETGISDDDSGSITVLAIGVDVQITPVSGLPGSTFQMRVTNTGQVAETFDLSLAAPAALVATLGTASVTLTPGAFQVVPINVGAIDFAFPGSISLAGIARSHINSAVQDTAMAEVTIAATHGMTAAFEPDTHTLPAPGETSFLLMVQNTGNMEDSFSATITGTGGSVTASLAGLDGQPTQSIAIFRLPGLASGAILLKTSSTAVGRGTVDVQIKSLANGSQLTARAAAIVQAAETPGVSVSPTNGLVTTENGGQAIFSVVLESVPTANVIIDLASTDTSEGTFSPTRLTFTPQNALTPQVVTITGADDDADDGNIAYQITTTASSVDPDYDGIDVADVAVINNDNDAAAGTSCTAPFDTRGIGGGGNVTAQLNKRRLLIQGDVRANAIRIDAESSDTFVVTGLRGTQVNGRAGPVRFRRVRSLDIGMDSGNDSVFFGPAAAAVDALLSRGLSIRMDAGDDGLALCGLDISGSTHIGGGLGSDRYVIDDSEFHGPATIGTGDEDDTILVETHGDPHGPPTIFHDRSSIDGKDGDDHVVLGIPGEPGNTVRFRAATGGHGGRRRRT